jgi:hypothetical protein
MKIHSLFLSLLSWLVVFAEQTSTQISSTQKTAVLIVGYDASCSAKYRMESIAITLKEKGIAVYKYFYPHANWNNIKARAKTCAFFIYTGHGYGNGGLNGGFGGLCINENIRAQEIIDGIKFQYKPLVIYLNACGSAGSSAGDPDDIGIQEATKRVCDTSLPFFMAGAGAYFATNTLNDSFLDELLKGKTISTCFRVFSEPQYEIYITETITSKNVLNLKTIGISGYQDQNKPKAHYYHTAFVGPANFTIKSIIQTSK